jgi:hypothetical protein
LGSTREGSQRQPPRKRTRKQIHPKIGPEKAFGQALREIQQGKEISQERWGPTRDSTGRTSA